MSITIRTLARFERLDTNKHECEIHLPWIYLNENEFCHRMFISLDDIPRKIKESWRDGNIRCHLLIEPIDDTRFKIIDWEL